MSDLKLEDHYKVELDAVKGLYKYSSCRTQNIPLFGHQVLPQNLFYDKPIISPNGKYISIIGKGKGEDKAFIWEIQNLDSYLYSYTSISIENLIFSPDSKYFYILYKGETPIKYEIKSGKEILSFKYPEEPINKMICYNFSSDGRTLYLGTKNKLNINNIKIIQEILYCEISPDKNYLYYATKNNIFRYNLKNVSKNNPEELIKFEDAEKIIINEECTNAISTDMFTIAFWDLKNRNNDIPQGKLLDLTQIRIPKNDNNNFKLK